MTLLDTKIAQSQVKELRKQAEEISQNTNLKFDDVYQSLRRQLLNGELDLFDLCQVGMHEHHKQLIDKFLKKSDELQEDK